MDKRKRILIIAVIIGSIIISAIANLSINLIQSFSYPKKYEELIEKYALEYNIPEYILYAVINTESGFDPSLRSSDGALGLMQLTADTFKYLISDKHLDEDIDFDNLSDPETSIRIGAYYLRHLFNKFKNWNVVFAAYNAGEDCISEWLNNPKYSKDGKALKKIPLSETKSYVKKAERAANYYKGVNEK